MHTKSDTLRSDSPAKRACSTPCGASPNSGFVPFSREETMMPRSLGTLRPWRRIQYLLRKEGAGAGGELLPESSIPPQIKARSDTRSNQRAEFRAKRFSFLF
jgi:hypothetical protein